MMKLGILGVGKMGSAILEGIQTAGLFQPSEILIYTPNLEHQNQYKKKGFCIAENEKKVFENSKLILLAIKPQIFSDVLPYAEGIDFSNRCVISIAAGISIKKIEPYFLNATIVRAMPNTPCFIGEGTTTICANVYNQEFQLAKAIFSCVGIVEQIEENQMDLTLPLNGSLPAYLYLFVKAFVDYAVKKGISLEISKNLCCNTVIGSAKMILNSEEEISTLIQNVCSKGGTTIEGLNELNQSHFTEIIEKCYESCVKRALELNKE